MEYNNKWQSRSAEEMLATFGSDAKLGLSKSRVEENRKKWGRNSLWNTGSPFMFLKNRMGLSLLGYGLMVISAVCAYFFGRFDDLSAMILSVVLGICMVGAMYITAGIICVAHSKKWIPLYTVIRDGAELTVAGDEIAVGDVVILHTGDICPADMKLIASENVSVNERASSGRRGIISKTALGLSLAKEGESAGEDFLYAASEVLSGEGVAVVCAVGDRTLFAARRGKADLIPQVEPARLKAMKESGSAIGTAVLVFSFFAVISGIISPLTKFGIVELVLIYLALAVSVLDEFLPAVGCLMYAATLWRCEKTGLVLRDIGGAEMLISADGVAIESATYMKTGETRLSAVRISEKTYQSGDTAADDLFSHLLVGTAYGEGKYGSEILRGLEHHLSSRGEGDAESFIKAVKNKNAVIESKVIDGTHYTITTNGVDVSFSAVGSIETVLSMCKKIRIDGKDIPLDKVRLSELLSAAKEALAKASSIVAVATRPSPYNSMKRLSVLMSDLTFVGFAALDSLADEGLASHLEYLRENGKKVVLFTDGSGEDINFTGRMGIISGREGVLDSSPEDVVASLFKDGSEGGAVLDRDGNTVTEVLVSAKRSGKKLISLGGSAVVGGGGFAVTKDRPKRGTGAFVADSAEGAVLPLIRGVRIAVSMLGRYNAVKNYFRISVLVRSVYALCAVFGLAYVYPTLLLFFPILDGGVAAGILFSGRGETQ